MESDFCVEAVKEAIELYGKQEIFNTDQGSRFTGDDFTSVLKDAQIKISMKGKGCWLERYLLRDYGGV